MPDPAARHPLTADEIRSVMLSLPPNMDGNAFAHLIFVMLNAYRVPASNRAAVFAQVERIFARLETHPQDFKSVRSGTAPRPPLAG